MDNAHCSKSVGFNYNSPMTQADEKEQKLLPAEAFVWNITDKS